MFSLERIQRLLIALAFLGFAFFAFRRGLAGQIIWLQLALMTIAAAVAVFGLKDRYWIVIPISMLSGITAMQLFGRNIRIAELSIIACTVIFLARMALLRDPLRLHLSATWPIYVHFFWVAAIYAINPVGLAIFGSESIGGLFYFQILMAAVSVTILASQTMREKDAKYIIRFAILASFFTPLLTFLRFQEIDTAASDSFYSWHQSLTTPAMLLLLYLLARYRTLNLRALLLFLLTLGIILMSGKRAGFVIIATLPVFSVILLQRSYVQAFGRLLVMLIFLGLLVSAHGTLVHFPKVAQRAMALMPGRWDQSLDALNEDIFREELRKLAWIEIGENPILGRRGYTIRRDEVIYAQYAQKASADMFSGHAYTANWHSAWLAFWVDFGLPAVLTYAAFLIIALRFGRNVFRDAEGFHYRQILAGMLVLRLFTSIITSYTSGHSASTLFGYWWMLGLLVAIHRGVLQDKKLPESEIEKTNTAPEFPGNETQPKPSIPPKHIPKLAYPATNS